MDVRIRPLEIEDAYTSVKWRNDPDVFRYTGNVYDHVITLDSEIEWIKRVIANPVDYRCAIIAEGVYVGNIYLTDIREGKANYHIFIGDKRFWGKGVAKEASMLIIQHGFETLQLHEINLKVKKQNTRAYSLYKRLGFKEYAADDVWSSMRIKKGDFLNVRISEEQDRQGSRLVCHR